MKIINLKVERITDELYQLIERTAENADEISSHYLSFLSEYYFLRNLLKTDFPRIKILVLEQFENLIDEWKNEI